MHYIIIIIIIVIKMQSELDKVKSTITISLGTKNRLRTLKGGFSYEQFINYLLRNNKVEKSNKKLKNTLVFQKFDRKQGFYIQENFGISFIYNKYVDSNLYVFDIQLKDVMISGRKVSFREFITSDNSSFNYVNYLKEEYRFYFKILEEAIKAEIEPLFKHKGSFEDYFRWQEEFKMLNLSKKSFEEDVMEKLSNYKAGVKLYD